MINLAGQKIEELINFITTMKKYLLLLTGILGILPTIAQGHYSFAVQVTGKGKPVIFIPGNAGSADTYKETVAHFKDRYTCYIVTLAGFAGQPPSGARDHLLLKQRDELIRFITDRHLQKPVLAGFSFGGALALWTATTRPDLVGPLIDLDGTPFDAAVDVAVLNKGSLVKAEAGRYTKLLAESPGYWRKRDSAWHSPESELTGFTELEKLVSDTARILQLLEWDRESDYRSMVLMNLEADTIDLREAVARIKSPVLVLGSWRGYDFIKSKREAEKRYGELYAKATNLTLIFSENGKHFLMWEDFDWMIGQMEKFLQQVNY
jgi:N-formylmaleamate deformylase